MLIVPSQNNGKEELIETNTKLSNILRVITVIELATVFIKCLRFDHPFSAL